MRIRRLGLRSSATGFTLTELAVVMAIVAFLIGGLMYTLSAQVEQRNFEDTRRRLELARELVLAFAITNGRLPCPARSVATAAPLTFAGDEVRNAATGDCTGDGVTDYYGGVNGAVTLGLLPARAIGFQQVDSSGLAVDVWGNRIRYAVAKSNTNCSTVPPVGTILFTNSTNLKTYGISCQPNDLLVCKSANVAPALTAASCGGPVVGANQIMSKSLLVAVIFSTGKNGATGGGVPDEAANLDGAGSADPVFVSHAPAPSTAAGGEFDDQFTWITVGEFYGKLIAAGLLP